jgi:hypothetical protein
MAQLDEGMPDVLQEISTAPPHAGLGRMRPSVTFQTARHLASHHE